LFGTQSTLQNLKPSNKLDVILKKDVEDTIYNKYKVTVEHKYFTVCLVFSLNIINIKDIVWSQQHTGWQLKHLTIKHWNHWCDQFINSTVIVLYIKAMIDEKCNSSNIFCEVINDLYIIKNMWNNYKYTKDFFLTAAWLSK